jgi:L-alanine-DL-glutamate epimerase-like enolase superfamily enzyme
MDANQGLSLDEAIRCARHYGALDVAWFEEPIHADDFAGHRRLTASTTVPIAVGESMYSLSQFKDYLQAGACTAQLAVESKGGDRPNPACREAGPAAIRAPGPQLACPN